MPSPIQVRKFHGLVTVKGKQFFSTYWVGMVLPADRPDPEDFTMVEVTPRYRTRSALKEAHNV